MTRVLVSYDGRRGVPCDTLTGNPPRPHNGVVVDASPLEPVPLDSLPSWNGSGRAVVHSHDAFSLNLRLNRGKYVLFIGG